MRSMRLSEMMLCQSKHQGASDGVSIMDPNILNYNPTTRYFNIWKRHKHPVRIAYSFQGLTLNSARIKYILTGLKFYQCFAGINYITNVFIPLALYSPKYFHLPLSILLHIIFHTIHQSCIPFLSSSVLKMNLPVYRTMPLSLQVLQSWYAELSLTPTCDQTAKHQPVMFAPDLFYQCVTWLCPIQGVPLPVPHNHGLELI